jgi:hypothetical protein|tara:strand:- start:141 stop:608 length:468 start_codon:yes stop_codon:yes gene_type:complete
VVELVDKVNQVDREVVDLFVVVVEQETQEVLLFPKVIPEVLVNNLDLVEVQEHQLMVVVEVVAQLLLEQQVLRVLVELEVQEHLIILITVVQHTLVVEVVEHQLMVLEDQLALAAVVQVEQVQLQELSILVVEVVVDQPQEHVLQEVLEELEVQV